MTTNHAMDALDQYESSERLVVMLQHMVKRVDRMATDLMGAFHCEPAAGQELEGLAKMAADMHVGLRAALINAEQTRDWLETGCVAGICDTCDGEGVMDCGTCGSNGMDCPACEGGEVTCSGCGGDGRA